MLIGNPAAWLARFQDVEQRLTIRLPYVWPVSIAGLPDQPHEDEITRRLVFHLRKDPETRRLGAIHCQLTLLEEQQQGDVVTKGYIDMAIVLGKNPECYVAFECKRLNVVTHGRLSSLASAYVEHGMRRYVCAQYARDLPLGGMIGYVLDGNTLAAERRVRAAIVARSSMMSSSSDPVVCPPIGFVRRLRTGHARSGEVSSFEIRHTFLPYPILPRGRARPGTEGKAY
jgi:hypothetical protein